MVAFGTLAGLMPGVRLHVAVELRALREAGAVLGEGEA